jgi:hypothetical protein
MTDRHNLVQVPNPSCNVPLAITEHTMLLDAAGRVDMARVAYARAPVWCFRALTISQHLCYAPADELHNFPQLGQRPTQLSVYAALRCVIERKNTCLMLYQCLTARPRTSTAAWYSSISPGSLPTCARATMHSARVRRRA